MRVTSWQQWMAQTSRPLWVAHASRADIPIPMLHSRREAPIITGWMILSRLEYPLRTAIASYWKRGESELYIEAKVRQCAVCEGAMLYSASSCQADSWKTNLASALMLFIATALVITGFSPNINCQYSQSSIQSQSPKSSLVMWA